MVNHKHNNHIDIVKLHSDVRILTQFLLTKGLTLHVWSLVTVLWVYGNCLESVWRMSGRCLAGVLWLSGGCLKSVWKVS